MPRGKKNIISDGLCFITDCCVTSHVNENRISDVLCFVTDSWHFGDDVSRHIISSQCGKWRQLVNCDETYNELDSSPIVNAVNDAITAAGTDGSLWRNHERHKIRSMTSWNLSQNRIRSVMKTDDASPMTKSQNEHMWREPNDEVKFVVTLSPMTLYDDFGIFSDVWCTS